MSTPSVQVERRVGQRFPYHLPLSLRQPQAGLEGVGFTQDLSSRGVFFFTDAPLTEGCEIEITLRMPSEITLGESMPVRCRGRILRVVRPTAKGNSDASQPDTQNRSCGPPRWLRISARVLRDFRRLPPGREPASPTRRRSTGSPVFPPGFRLMLAVRSSANRVPRPLAAIFARL